MVVGVSSVTKVSVEPGLGTRLIEAVVAGNATHIKHIILCLSYRFYVRSKFMYL
jgi:hypothetical protein